MTMCIYSNGGYPLGAQNDPRAPYNQKEEKVKVNVTVSVTYSTQVEVEVEKGYSYPELREAVKELDILPNDILKKHGYKPWFEDEFEVVPDTF